MTLPHFKPHTKRVRVTEATKRRDQNVRLMIEALRCGSIMKDDLRDMMAMSQSSINKYCQLLREAGVIEIERTVGATRFSSGTPVFRLVRDRAVVDAYLRSLTESAVQQATDINARRHIHRMQDDGRWPERVPVSGIPAPDPVLAHFFGMRAASAT